MGLFDWHTTLCWQAAVLAWPQIHGLFFFFNTIWNLKPAYQQGSSVMLIFLQHSWWPYQQAKTCGAENTGVFLKLRRPETGGKMSHSHIYVLIVFDLMTFDCVWWNEQWSLCVHQKNQCICFFKFVDLK